MKRRWPTWLWVLGFCGCALEPPSLPDPSPTLEPTLAVTEASPRPTTTPTALVPTASPTVAPAPTAPLPSPPPVASTPALSPSASPSPSLTPTPADRSFCRRSFGAERAARFSARLDAIQVHETEEQIEVTLSFVDLDGAMHGMAACFWASSWPQTGDLGSSNAPGPAYIGLALDGWAHDDAFTASIITETLELTTNKALTPARATATRTRVPASDARRDGDEGLQLALAANSLDSRGALIGIGLPEPRPFAVHVQGSKVIIEVAQSDAAPFPPTDDPLGAAQGEIPSPHDLFWVQDGELYRFEDGAAAPISTTLRAITDLAVDPAGDRLAVCARAEIDSAKQASALWLVDTDGANLRLLADVGGCAEPAFDLDGQTIAFVAPVDGSETGLPQVWTTPNEGGEARSIGSALDPWSRSTPRWLNDERLVYRAAGEDGTSLLLINEAGVERELSARLLTGTAYRGIGTFMVDAAAELIAVQALRTVDDGSDLVVLRADGSIVATEQRGFAQQSLGFIDRGLVYLTVECPSATVQRYALRVRTERGIETLLTGSTAGSIDATLAQGETLLYVRHTLQEAVLESNDDVFPQPTSEVWIMSGDGASRTQLGGTSGTITALAGSTQ